MRLKPIFPLYIAIVVVLSLSSAHGQVVAAGRGGHRAHVPIELGFGGSDFSMDWGKDQYGGAHRENGITAWINTDVPVLSHVLKGLAVEIEGRHLNYSQPPGLSRLRADTILGGPTYTVRSSLPVRPYAKLLWGMGSLDFPPLGNYSHDTRVVTAPGAGIEARIHGPIWVRGDYEYQFWPKLFGPHTLNPNGFSFGIAFDSRTLGESQ